MARLVAARRATYPPGYADEGWGRWVPEQERDLRDARTWLVCLAFAAYSPVAGEAVHEVWDRERSLVQDASGSAARDGGTDDDMVHALAVGLTVLRAVGPGMTHERAHALLERLLRLLRDSPEAGQR